MTQTSLPLLVWSGPVFDPSEQGVVVRSGIAGALAAGLDVRIQEVRWPGTRAALASSEKAGIDRLIWADFLPQPYVKLWDVPASHFRTDERAVAVVGRTSFWTDAIPADWVGRCNEMDMVLVPSEFHAETFHRCGVLQDKLRVVPCGIDLAPIESLDSPVAFNTGRAFNFISVVEWSARGGWDILIDAWSQEFHPDDDVALVLLVHAAPPGVTLQRIQQDIQQRLAVVQGIAPLSIATVSLFDPNFPNVFRGFDVFVKPNPGEAWGHTLLTAMAGGLPAIAPGWGVAATLLTPRNSYLLDSRVVTVPGGRIDMGGPDHRWAEPSVTSLRDQFRKAFSSRTEVRARGAAARHTVEENFSQSAFATRLSQVLLELVERKPLVASATRRRSTAVQLSVVWRSHLDGTDVTALANRALVRALSSSGQVVVTHEDVRVADELSPSVDIERAPGGLPGETQSTRAVIISHEERPQRLREPSLPFVVMQSWPYYGGVPLDWMEALQAADEIWVPSDLLRSCFIESGLSGRKVWVVPYGVDLTKYRMGAPPLLLPSVKTARFLFVGSLSAASGLDLVLAAYTRVFTRKDDVCLVIKTLQAHPAEPAFDLDGELTRLRTNPDCPEILVLTEPLATAAMPCLYTACDCLIYPYRTDAFGLPVLEAMSCGRPAIVTRGGACDALCLSEETLWIDSQRRDHEIPGLETTGLSWVLEPSQSQLEERLQETAQRLLATVTRGDARLTRVAEQFSWQSAAKHAIERLEGLTQPSIAKSLN